MVSVVVVGLGRAVDRSAQFGTLDQVTSELVELGASCRAHGHLITAVGKHAPGQFLSICIETFELSHALSHDVGVRDDLPDEGSTEISVKDCGLLIGLNLQSFV